MKTKRRSRTAQDPVDRGQGWRTTDIQELAARRERAAVQRLRVEPASRGASLYFDDFRVHSASVEGLSYEVQIRSLHHGNNLCECPDFAKSGLGHCKHVEAVLTLLRRRGKRAFETAAMQGSPLVEVGLRRDLAGEHRVYVSWPAVTPPAVRECVAPFFSASGDLLADPADAIPALCRQLDRTPAPARRAVRLGQDALRLAERVRARRARESDRAAWTEDVAAGKRSATLVRNATLLDYQREGALHMAFAGRALLADEMGLGKTIQAIAACALLHQLRRAARVLVVAPVSLKTEWDEQIARFTDLPASVLVGSRAVRLRAYRNPVFFTLANYEQVVTDWREINDVLRPDVVILDEAQRIKNWRTRTAGCIKRLRAPYAFVLTGTPIENRIDEVYSIVEFLDPGVFGSLFRFNRDFYELDPRGKPVAVCNLEELHRRLQGVMLRRRKAEIDEALPSRTQKNYFVAMAPEQRKRYAEYEEQAVKLIMLAERRPLTPKEQNRLQLLLACMRMVCDTPYILDPECRVCPKLDEFDALLDDILAEPDAKAIVFSEWVRMLDLLRERLDARRIGYAVHTGSIPQQRRRAEIQRFKTDPACRLFLSSDSGATGLNLQCANVVINLDLPWNPAKLEQRIARAWRKNQLRSVHVANLVTDNSIESRMLVTLETKRDIARGALDDPSVSRVDLGRNREQKLRRLNELLGRSSDGESIAAPPSSAAKPAPPAADPALAFGEDLSARLGARLKRVERVKATRDGAPDMLLAVVEDGAAETRALACELLERNFERARTPAPSLEVLDAATLDLLRRLTEAGLIQPGPALRQTLTASADGVDRQAVAARREAVAKLRQLSARAAGMARLLGANGYAAESLAPWREAIGVALKALRLSSRPLAEGHEETPTPAAAEAVQLLRELAGADAVELRAWAAIQDGAPAAEAPDAAPLAALHGKIESALA
jgi:superfamily II DNA/RNA helicase